MVDNFYDVERMYSGSDESDVEIALRICSEDEDTFRMVLVELALIGGERGKYFERFIWASQDHVTQALLLDAEWERKSNV